LPRWTRRQNRKFASSAESCYRLRVVPSFIPPGAIPLDVTLTRTGIFRRWTLNAGDLPDYWSCRLLSPTSVTVTACFTEADCWLG